VEVQDTTVKEQDVPGSEYITGKRKKYKSEKVQSRHMFASKATN